MDHLIATVVVVRPSSSMRTSKPLVILRLGAVCPKMTDQANSGTECPGTYWVDLCRHCSCCAGGSGLAQLVLKLCFSIAPCFISLTALVDEAAPGRAVLCQRFPGGRVYVKRLHGGLEYVFETFLLPSMGASSSRKFPKKELLGYALVRHTDDMTCPPGLCSHQQCMD